MDVDVETVGMEAEGEEYRVVRVELEVQVDPVTVVPESEGPSSGLVCFSSRQERASSSKFTRGNYSR
jgi:hypothetical protein